MQEKSSVPFCLSRFLPPIIAMLLLLLFLFTGLLKIDHIKEKSDFLLSNMAFFFIPAGVKVVEHLELVSSIWLPFLIIVIVSTAAVLLVTAAAVTLVMKAGERRKTK